MIAYIYSLSKHLKEGGVINYIFPVFYGLFAYVFINYDFRLISYDSEPDYIANGLLILKNGFPLNSHHPGTMTYYIVSLFLYLAKLMGFGLSNTVIFIRSLFFLIGLFVYLVFNKISRINILICFSLFLVIPGFRLVTNVFSNELLLIPCSFLLLYLLKFKTKRKDLYLSIIFGLTNLV